MYFKKIKEKRMAKTRTLLDKRSAYLVTDKKMPFNYVEAYKSLRTNIEFITDCADGGKCIVITSAVPMESKSNVSLNLSVSLAEDNKKVLLIDADLRKSSIQTMLHIKHTFAGLSTWLKGRFSLDEVIVHSDTLNIDIVPSGTIPPNPSELLSGDMMKTLITSMRACYDYIIIDAPPISVVTDAAIIAGMADGTLLVVRSDYARLDVIQLAKQRLTDVNAKIMGVVLTRYNPKNSAKKTTPYYYSNEY